MRPVKLITNLAELEGTDYFEFLPGEYRGKCWNHESAFMDEEVFGFLEPIVANCEPKYDHYAFTPVQRGTWERILQELTKLQTDVAAASDVSDLGAKMGLFFSTTQDTLAADFASYQPSIVLLIGSFSAWVRSHLKKHETISILGL
jgi:hypothetical protein